MITFRNIAKKLLYTHPYNIEHYTKLTPVFIKLNIFVETIYPFLRIFITKAYVNQMLTTPTHTLYIANKNIYRHIIII